MQVCKQISRGACQDVIHTTGTPEDTVLRLNKDAAALGEVPVAVIEALGQMNPAFRPLLEALAKVSGSGGGGGSAAKDGGSSGGKGKGKK